MATGDMCALIPTVNRKKSKLYKDILDYTGKNRPLTNLLYAAALSDQVKSLFTQKEFNDQNEIDFKALKTKFNLDQYVNAQQALQGERLSIGAIDSNGQTIYYDNPDLIKDRVLDYNNTHNVFHAKIDYSRGKYTIVLDVTDATNFKTNAVIENLTARFSAMNDYLRTIGITPTYSEFLKNTIANFRNYRTLRNLIIDFQGGSEGVRNMSEVKARLLMELVATHSVYGALANRILSQFGDDTGKIVSLVSTGFQGDLPGMNSTDSAYWKKQITAAINNGITIFQNFDVDALINAENAAVQGLPINTEKVLGVSILEVDDVLNDLDKRFHIKQDLIVESGKQIRSLSDVAKRLLSTSSRKQQLQKIKTGSEDKKLRNINRKNKKLIDDEDYVTGVVNLLGNVYSDFEKLQKTIESIKPLIAAKTDDLGKINVWSKIVMEALSLVDAYEDVVRNLTNIENLDIDQEGIPEQVLKDIEKTAKGLNFIINDVRTFAQGAEFDLTYMFLQKFWGDNDVKTFGDKTYSLNSIISTLSQDVNIVEKLFLSMNESTDAALGLFYEAVKTNNRQRDKILRNVDYVIRTITDNLASKGGRTSSVFNFKDGVPSEYLKAEVDFEKFDKEKAEFKKQKWEEGLRGDKLDKAMMKWERENLKARAPFSGQNYTDFLGYIKEYVHELYGIDTAQINPLEYTLKILMPKAEKYGIPDAQTLGLNPAEREYYLRMMALKSILTVPLPFGEKDFFKTIQVSADTIERVGRAGFNPKEQLKILRDAFVDTYTIREDNTEYGDSFSDLLAGNNVQAVATDMRGMQLMQLPLFFTHKLKDQTRVTTDMSMAMSAFATSAVNYSEMSKMIDAFTLAQDYLTTKRGFTATGGNTSFINIMKYGRDTAMETVSKDIRTSRSAEQLNQFVASNIYNQRKNRTGEFSLFGIDISTGRAVDTLTQLTSISGLTVNLLGAEANLLVGQIQMFIDGQAGEFFNLKDFAVAEGQYLRHLPAYMAELYSNNKKALITLLGERFDVMEDYYNTLKNNGFKSSLIGRVLDNTALMFLYGAGEHLLHNQTMFAILNHQKVFDTQTNTEVPLLNIFSVQEEGNNGKLIEDRVRYKWIERNSDGSIASTREINDDDIEGIEKQITYCNKSMHGAFSAIDRGTIHRWAVGRLFMNFRQWMPEHYARRFNALHRDADLGEFRRGYYTSTFVFLKDAVSGLVKNRTSIAASWNAMSEMDRYNCKRAIAEVEVLLLLSLSNLSLGSYKDKKGNWAYRNLMYETKRMLMEVEASTPAFIPGLTNPLGMVSNFISIMNSPFAALSTINKIADTMNILDLFDTIEGGKYDGENKYLHNLDKNLLFVGQIKKQIDLIENDDLFNVFKNI